MERLDESFDEITAVFALPKPYRKRLRTTNGVELWRRELAIRIFPNEERDEARKSAQAQRSNHLEVIK